MAKAKPAGAFTVIELMVSVAVIALVAAAILPSVTAARDAARRSGCLSNQRQLGVGLAQYMNDYEYVPGGNPYEYGAGAVVTPFGLNAGDPTAPGSPYYVYGSVTVNLWADTAQENNPAMGQSSWGIPPQTTAIGIGCVGPYISSSGQYKDADGKLFYCPGNPVSFNPTVSGPAWYPGQFQATAPNNTNEYFTAYGGYWSGWANYGEPTTFNAWVAAGRPTSSEGNKALNADNSCLSTYSFRGGDWSLDKNLPLSSPEWTNNWTCDGGGQGYFSGMLVKSSSPYVQGRVTLTDWWYNLESYSDVLDYGSLTWPQNMPHRGVEVNNLWTDGHAATFKLTPACPTPLWGWTDQGWADGPNGPKTQAGFNPTSNSPWVGFYSTMPFWWAVADQTAP